MTPELNNPAPSAPTHDPTPSEPFTLNQRMLAEAVRLHEEAQGLLEEPQADAAARAADGDLEHRIISRAQALSIAPALTKALHQLRSVCGLVVVVGLVMTAIAGASTAQLTLGTETTSGPINFFWVLAGILGVHTLFLVLWLSVIFVRPKIAAIGSLGGIAFALGRWITRWLHRGPLPIAAIRAGATVYGSSSLGRWVLSSISHALWLAFLSGCLALVILILSIKQYTFTWETTILSDRTYVALTRVIAAGPQALGFTTPTAQQIRDSHWTRQGQPSGESREAWSGLLIGSIIAYGLLPRAILLALCLFAWRRASTRWRLDTTKPGYARLQTRLQPVAKTLGVVDADTTPANATVTKPTPVDPPALGQSNVTAIVGLEIEPPQTAWPPSVKGVDWLDLGYVDSRTERQQALAHISTSAPPPRLIVVVCSLATTPDRGTRAFIQELQTASRVPVALVLTDGQRLRRRSNSGEVAQRVADWHLLATAAAVADERVAEVDLDHITDASRTKLAALLAAKQHASGPGRGIGRSFAVILEHAKQWHGEPSIEQQAELHRAIAGLYQGERSFWQELLRAKIEQGSGHFEGLKTNAAALKTSAERMLALLPERLRKSPKWLAAGAMAGALGCVAAATLVTPAAIAALPAWAGLGAAVAALVQPAGPSVATTPATVDWGATLSSAALFAVLLEVQGRDEVTITRLIDRAAGDDEPVIASFEAAQQWLDAMQHRFDLALAAEGAG